MMFIDAWTKAAPEHWMRKKLKYFASLRSGESITADSIKDEGDFPVYGGNGLRGYTTAYTHEGEFVLIGRQGALCGNVNYAKDRFWASEHAIVVTRLGDYDQTWLGELLRHLDLNRLSQSAAQPGISAEEVSNVLIAVPPLKEQIAIASYLNGETARIDALVDAKQRVLDLLAEKRKAIIATAVTRGLDPNVTMRDSLVPWLGEIPSHWEVKRAKWMFVERDDRSQQGGEELLSLRMERGLVPHNDVSPKQTRPEELVGYKKTSHGEIVINRMRASLGLIAVTPQEGLVSPDYAVFQATSGVSVSYYEALFKTELMGGVFRAESTGMGTGSAGFLRLYSESFLSIWLPHPPRREQDAIVDYVSRATARIDSVRAATERTIALLKERRTALIAAAVTGKLDLGAAA